jgi:EAL domain-containing protein (putative c-di-GMP-specific phosphodiesterase class I)
LSIAPHRLLGFAFASADLLVELDACGKIAFAVGAAGVIAGAGESSLVGRSLIDLVHPADQDLVWALISGAESGGRQGPIVARLTGARPGEPAAFAMSLCKLPQNEGAISCGLTRAVLPGPAAGEDGLLGRQDFETVAKSLFDTARSTGQELELSFVEMEGLAKAAGALPQDRQVRLMGQVAGALRAQSHGGHAAARLGDDRYAVVRAAGEPAQALADRLGRLMSLVDAASSVRPGAKSMALKGEASPSQIVRAVRYALDDFLEGGLASGAPQSLQDAVGDSVRHTLKKANALGVAVAERRFKLAFQPVVTLATGETHHHEVLVRFGEDESPFPMIRMAEELDLIEDLDLAVVHRAAGEMAADPKLKLAVNVSGRTITSPAFIARMTELVKSKRTLKARLMFEVTESATIDDLALANRHIQALRRLGCLVCLDDFGAGAASLAYLQQLSLDVVKIDGRYIRELQHGGRESTFLRHLVSMCAELGVKTLAEMVETAEAEEAVRRAGVDFGQGYFYGAPAERPQAPAAIKSPVAARRRGAVESWS